MSQHLNKLKNDLGKDYDSLFLKRQLNIPNRDNNNNKQNLFQRNYVDANRNNSNNKPIKIEREEIPAMSKEEFLADIAELEQSTNENKIIVNDDHSMSIFIEKEKEKEKEREKEKEKEKEREKEREERCCNKRSYIIRICL